MLAPSCIRTALLIPGKNKMRQVSATVRMCYCALWRKVNGRWIVTVYMYMERYRLLISILSVYGLHESVCLLIANYFTYRKQRVKIGVTRSEWSHVIKETPQGSILGPYVLNIFQNDLMYLLTSLCNIYNYKDDNTVWCMSNNFQQLKINVHISPCSARLAWVKLYTSNPI